jgi:anti-sigma regulatory factor (Ser/Thr protein kinase)
MERTQIPVETVVVKIEMAKILYDCAKQFAETSGLGYDDITEFIEAATREYLLRMRRVADP